MTIDPLGQETGPTHRQREWLHRWFTLPIAAVIVLGIAMLALSAAVVWLLTHEDRAPILSELPAGRVMRVELHDGIFSRSLVETDLGFYALLDPVSLNKGEQMTLLERQGGRCYLCDIQHRCTRLMQPWL